MFSFLNLVMVTRLSHVLHATVAVLTLNETYLQSFPVLSSFDKLQSHSLSLHFRNLQWQKYTLLGFWARSEQPLSLHGGFGIRAQLFLSIFESLLEVSHFFRLGLVLDSWEVSVLTNNACRRISFCQFLATSLALSLLQLSLLSKLEAFDIFKLNNLSSKIFQNSLIFFKASKHLSHGQWLVSSSS